MGLVLGRRKPQRCFLTDTLVASMLLAFVVDSQRVSSQGVTGSISPHPDKAPDPMSHPISSLNEANFNHHETG